MKTLGYFLLLFLGLGEALFAQEGNSKAATGGARPPQMNQGFLGRDVPVMDPGSDTSTFDGKLWNMNNNRLFRSRFEKYCKCRRCMEAVTQSIRISERREPLQLFSRRYL